MTEEELRSELEALIAQKAAYDERLYEIKNRIRDVRSSLSEIRRRQQYERRKAADPLRAEKDAKAEALKAQAKNRRGEALSMRRAGLKYPDIAEAMGLSVSRVRSLVGRAERLERWEQRQLEIAAEEENCE